jgi:hypothetical protein
MNIEELKNLDTSKIVVKLDKLIYTQKEIDKMLVNLGNRRNYNDGDIHWSVYLNSAVYPQSIIFDVIHRKNIHNDYWLLWVNELNNFEQFNKLCDLRKYIKYTTIPNLLNDINKYIDRNDLLSVESCLRRLGL